MGSVNAIAPKSFVGLPISLVLGLTLSMAPAGAEPLRVGVAGSPPFVVNNGSELEGISVELWKEIATAQEWDYEFIPQPNPEVGIAAIAEGKLDVVIGAIAVTADDLTKVEFTQPFYIGQEIVLYSSESPTLWSRLSPLFGTVALSSLGFLGCCLFIVGNLMWLAERHRNSEHFPKEYLRGVGNGMWFALVTLTTVGYGDRTPVTPAGRFIAGSWMLLTLIAASSLTAGLASALTLSLSNMTYERFSRPEDLENARITVISGTSGVRWAEYYGARPYKTSSLERAAERVLEGKSDGAIFGRDAADYFLKQHSDLTLKMSEFSVATENYAFALPFGSPIAQELNIALIKLQQNGRVRELRDKWVQD